MIDFSSVSIVYRVLQSIEFFRSGSGRWFSLFFQKLSRYKIFTIPLFIWSVIKISISGFTLFCSSVSTYLRSVGFSGIRVGGVNILTIANTVFPVDEFVALLVAWVSLYAVCASIRFARAAWSAIPFKAS